MLSHIQAVKTALGSLQRLRRQLDEVVQTRLPGWLSERPTEAAAESEPGQLEAPAEQSLARKRREAMSIVELYAGWSAANAFNPIPLLDVAIDVRIWTAMTEAMAAVYGLRPEQLRALASRPQQLADRASPHLAERVFTAVLSRLGPDLVVRETSKWLPLLGSLLAARLGYHMTRHFGHKLREECEATAEQAAPVPLEAVA